MIEPVKPPGVVRIFIFGESAAQGDPEPSFGAGRYLEALLRERYPGVKFEVVNVAITAINSHVIVPIARECARCQGDLWIVYMGNNEMIGPFGAATVFGAKAPPWPLVRLGLALQTTRLGQLAMNIDRHLAARRQGQEVWGGLQMFLGNELSPDDPRKEIVYKNFDRNLRDILRAGLESGAAVILNTVAVNLKDCPPFASIHSAALNPVQKETCERDYAEAQAAEAREDWSAAAAHFAEAAGLDPQMAEYQFGQAECLERLHQNAPAAACFQKACDDDALCFRADSRINGIIRQSAEKLAGSHLALCDAAALLPKPGVVPGEETFYEHVHFNFDGNYRLALLWAAQAAPLLPAAVQAKADGAWATQETCEARLGLTDWNRGDVYNAVRERMERQPLASQANNNARMARLGAEIAAILRRRNPATAEAAQKLYSDAITRWPEDYVLHENYGEFLELTGNIPQAADQWDQARELMPRNPFACLTAGQLREREGKFPAARQDFEQAIALHPRYAEAWFELGKLAAAQRSLSEALADYRHSAALQPYDSQTFVDMGKALSLLKRPGESVTNFEYALELDPNNWEAHYALGGEFGLTGQIEKAKDQFMQVVRLQPQYAMGHLNLGVALLKLNDRPGARAEFSEALRLDPANRSARSYLAAISK